MIKYALLRIGLAAAVVSGAAAQSYYPYYYPGYGYYSAPVYSYPTYSYPAYGYPYGYSSNTYGLTPIRVRPTGRPLHIPTPTSRHAPIRTALGRERAGMSGTDRRGLTP